MRQHARRGVKPNVSSTSHLEPGSKDERSVMWTPIDSHTKEQSLQLPITTHGPVQCNSVPLLARRSFIPCAHTYVCVYNSTSVCSVHISSAWCSLMNIKLPTYLPLGVSNYDPTWPSHTEMQDMHVTLVPLCTQTTTRGVCHTSCSPCQPPPTQLALILIPSTHG